ncbi:MAG TPA: glycogen/starch/alpha-glucan phosphorylase [Candidatus Merdivicinus faecavium]|nr:glycogen/starch/alpha-glucan phosphorylase [Candidatus Merdivicinus faecavium]
MTITQKLNLLLEEEGAGPLEKADGRAVFRALLRLTGAMLAERPQLSGEKKLYYISAEFLIGKLLSNNLINLGIREEVAEALEAAGHSLSEIEELEAEPALGNGGLGRLAACYLDSAATLELPCDGVGLCYHYGLFRQKFEELKQREYPDVWRDRPGWLTKTGVRFPVSFPGLTLEAVLYELPVSGYGGGLNRLRLFDAATADGSIVGEGIDFDKTDIARNLTLFLYPDDSDEAGRLLRVYQQYFMVSAAAQLILKELKDAGHPPASLPAHAVIQINDTHPSLIIPELIRLLMAEGMAIGDAIEAVSRTCAYTNHTILAEALEKWPVDYLEKAVPQLMPIIRELDARAQAAAPELAEKIAIIDGNDLVHMARMDIHYGFSVNGVAALHTKILKETELSEFYALYPEKFNNKTNGITFRRWLMQANPRLSDFVTSLIGEGWKRDGNFEKLAEFAEDRAVLERLLAVKAENKRELAAYLAEKEGVEIDPDSVFDIQIKRMHQYKRQQMNALWVIWKYLEIKAGRLPKRPVTVLFGAKAAPAYTLAKDTIHLILCLQELINGDSAVSPWLKVVMVENYNVTWAEKLIPACDISEQISLASKEASGTGNMKFMLNGAVTLGTLDGANVEISELVGEENIFLFGKKSGEVIDLYATEGYRSADFYDGDPEIERLVDFVISKQLIRIGDPENLARVYKDFVCKDWFMTLLDLREYIEVKERMLASYEDRLHWAKMALINIAHAGFFSSDRAVAQYNEEIWRLKPDRSGR